MKAIVLTHWIGDGKTPKTAHRPVVSGLVKAWRDITGQKMAGLDAISKLPENGVVVEVEATAEQLAACTAAGATVLWREDQHAKGGAEEQAALAKATELRNSALAGGK